MMNRFAVTIIIIISLAFPCMAQTITLPDGKHVIRNTDNSFDFYNLEDVLIGRDAFPSVDPQSIVIQRSGQNPPFSYFAIQVGSTIRAYCLSDKLVYRSATWANTTGSTQISVVWNESSIWGDISSPATYGQFQFTASATPTLSGWGVIYRPPHSIVTGVTTILTTSLPNKKKKHKAL